MLNAGQDIPTLDFSFSSSRPFCQRLARRQALRAGHAAEMEEAGYMVAGGDPQTVKLEAPGRAVVNGCWGNGGAKTN